MKKETIISEDLSILYSCQTCSNTFSSIFQLAEHKNLHSDEKPFMCPNCGAKFPLVNLYVEHFEKYPGHHYFPCCECCIVFRSHKELEEHTCDNVLNVSRIDESGSHSDTDAVDVEDQVQEEKYPCIQCEKTFSSKKQLRTHERQYPEYHKFSCGWCLKVFTTLQKLDKHLCFISQKGEEFVMCSCLQSFDSSSEFRSHIGPKPHTCCSCKMIFSNVSNLMKHIRTHTQQKPFTCKECGRSFTQASILRNHLSIHLGTNAMKCDLCSFSCKTPSGLFKHKKKHAEGREVRDLRKISTREYVCSVCTKRFRFHRNLSMHMKSHETDECLCKDCGKLFTSKSKLSNHMRNNHGDPCVCSICGKVLANASLLRGHSKIHVSKKDFTCSICYKRFAIKSYLFYHMKTHDERRRYSCEKCGKMFKVATSLKYHSRISCQKINI